MGNIITLKQHIDWAKYILLLTKEPNNTTINHKKKTIVMPTTSYKHTNFSQEDALLRKTTYKQLYFCMHSHASCTMEKKRYRPLASDVPHQKDNKLISTHSHTNLFQFVLSPHTLCHFIFFHPPLSPSLSSQYQHHHEISRHTTPTIIFKKNYNYTCSICKETHTV